MGQRSNTETIAAILAAFLDTRTWKQAELARHVGIQPAALHKRLTELQASGIPLTSEREHPTTGGEPRVRERPDGGGEQLDNSG